MMGVLMSNCSFEKLLQLLDKQLDLDGELEVFDHLDHCENCRDAVYHIMRDRDSGYFVVRPYRIEKQPTSEDPVVS
jgi:hypothetical protein